MRPRIRGAASGPAPAVALLLLAGLHGCGPDGPESDPSLEVDVAVSPTPATVGEGRVRVQLRDTAGRPVDEARVQVTGLMTHAGMVPVTDTAASRGGGLWAVDAFDFTMAGDWVLEVRAELPDGRRAAADHPIRVVSPPPGGGDAGRD